MSPSNGATDVSDVPLFTTTNRAVKLLHVHSAHSTAHAQTNDRANTKEAYCDKLALGATTITTGTEAGACALCDPVHVILPFMCFHVCSSVAVR